MQWKKDYRKREDAERITHWLAIDDRALLEERHGTNLRDHFVQTQPMRGLTVDAADECIKILTQDVPIRQPQGIESLPVESLDALVAAVGPPVCASLRGSSTGPAGRPAAQKSLIAKAATMPPGRARGRSVSTGGRY